MRTLLWVLGWIGVGVWTLFALVGWGALGLFGEVARSASGQVPGFPVETFSMAWLADMAHRLGGLALLFVWAIGTAMILAVPAIASLFFRRRDARRASVDPRALRMPSLGRGTVPYGGDLARKILRPFPRRGD